MGEATLNNTSGELIISAILYFYGDEAGSSFAEEIAAGIQSYWNEPEAWVAVKKRQYLVRFDITGRFDPSLKPERVWYNDDPRLNFFRIEKFVTGGISFVDGIGCNTGYFKLDNLLQDPSTAAHEFGHTIGLTHPSVMDIRGGKRVGIMYPRGTHCDPALQYDPNAAPGEPGGFLNPRFRKVGLPDIEALRLHKLNFNDRGVARLGEFTSIYHEKHSEGFGSSPQ